MKALVFHGPGQRTWESHDDPGIQEPTDVVVRIDTTTICGTDLHILKGDVPAVTEGRVLGHEAVGTVVEVGDAVRSLAVEDRVIVPAISSCGRCSMCRRGLPAHCLTLGGIGWVFGHLIDGLQAQYARVPYAETSLHRVPEGVSDEQVLFLTDILPTGFEIGIQDGGVRPGDTVAVIGVGPVGLAAAMTASLHGAARVIAVDGDRSRLEAARRFGATDAVVAGETSTQEVLDMTDGLGVDVAIEAVGVPATFEACCALVRPGGAVANVGVHGAPVQLPLDELWIKNIRISMGLVNATTVPTLLELVRSGRLPAEQFATHRFALDEIEQAYDVFGAAAEHDALKVVLTQ